MYYFDTHCHLNFECFKESLDGLLEQCEAQGINRFLIPGTCSSSFEELFQIARSNSGVYIALGVHPFFIQKNGQSQLRALRECLLNEDLSQVKAIGEFGLDRFCNVDHDIQYQVAEEQFSLARDMNLPVILHNRKSSQKLLSLIDRYSVNSGVVHGFTGSYELGLEFISRGFYLGVGGAITWSNAKKVRDSISRLPLGSMMLETDSPDMSPQWLRGENNTPLSLIGILKVLAELKSVDVATAAAEVYANSCRLFDVEAS